MKFSSLCSGNRYYTVMTYYTGNSWDEFEHLLDEKGGFISAHWDGTPESEEAIKEKLKATIRCIPEQSAGSGSLHL
jgi:hypothetical protein